MTKTTASSYEGILAELSHLRLHALGARFSPDQSSGNEFLYTFRRWTIRIRVSPFMDGATLEAHIRTGGLNLRALVGGWESLLGPASVGIDRMYPTPKSFLVELYRATMSRRDVQDDLSKSKTWHQSS